MNSRLVMGVAAYFLLISAVAISVETQDAQLAGTLLVDVEAKADVEVFCFIFGGDNESEANITFTIFYAMNLEDPTNFRPGSPGAMSVNTTDDTGGTMLPSVFPPSTNVTVVVRAVNDDNGASLESSPPVTRQTFDAGIGAPMNVSAQRPDDNRTLEVTWLPINSPQLRSYDVEYRIFKTTGSTGFPGTIINSENIISKLTIGGLDGDTNYEVRVRGVIEALRESEIIFTNGPWSDWVVSQVRVDPEPITASGTATVKAIFTYFIAITILLLVC